MRKHYSISILMIFFGLSGFINKVNAQWSQANTSLLGTKVSALVSSGSDFLAACGSSRVFVSHDNGASWTSSISGLASTSYWALETNGTTIFTGGDQGVFSSTDNGVNWSATGLTSNIYELAVSGSTVIAGSSGGGVYYSANSGTTWTSVPLGFTTNQIGALTIQGSTIFAGTYDGMFKSTNQGATWTQANTGLPVNPFIKSLLTVGSTIFAGTHNGGIYKSTDNGSTWIASNTGLTYDYITSLASNGTSILAGSNYYGAFLSNDNGVTWTDVTGNLPNTDLVSCALSSSVAIVGGANSNRAWSVPLSQITTEIKTTEKEINFSFSPNPANDHLTIRLNDFKNVELEILSLQGQVIMTVSLQEENTRIKTADLAKGIYFIKLKSTEGVAVKKLIKD